MVVNPSEPVLPLDMLNVTSPDDGYVLRGVGWRGGEYTNMPGILPLTGAATRRSACPAYALLLGYLLPDPPVEYQLLRLHSAVPTGQPAWRWILPSIARRPAAP